MVLAVDAHLARDARRVFTELLIDAPYPRDERFRTSADYVGHCRQVLDALTRAIGTAEGP